MLVNKITGTTFGKIYYSDDCNKITKTQADVLDDIKYTMEEKGYEKRLKRAGYDIYIEPRSDGYVMDMAFIGNARFDRNNRFVYDKIVLMGGYKSEPGSKYNIKNFENTYSIESLEARVEKFFKNLQWKKYKRFYNSL